MRVIYALQHIIGINLQISKIVKIGKFVVCGNFFIIWIIDGPKTFERSILHIEPSTKSMKKKNHFFFFMVAVNLLKIILINFSQNEYETDRNKGAHIKDREALTIDVFFSMKKAIGA